MNALLAAEAVSCGFVSCNPVNRTDFPAARSVEEISAAIRSSQAGTAPKPEVPAAWPASQERHVAARPIMPASAQEQKLLVRSGTRPGVIDQRPVGTPLIGRLLPGGSIDLSILHKKQKKRVILFP